MPRRVRMARDAAIEGLQETIDSLASAYQDFEEAEYKSLEFYIDTLIIKHFLGGNAEEYGYTPLSPKYKKWKEKHFPGMPQEVLTGKLAQAVVQGYPEYEGSEVIARFTLPAYAGYQILQGRDIISPSPKDEQMVMDFLNQYYDDKRNKRASKTINKRINTIGSSGITTSRKR